MNADMGTTNSIRQTFAKHLRITLTGLLVVLIPLSIASKAIEHLEALLRKALVAVQPKVDDLGGVEITLMIVAAILAASWLIGLLMTRTEFGQRILEWENSLFRKRSPVLQKQAKREDAEEKKAVASAAQPALARLQGGWQPGVIISPPAGGWASVYIPDLPAAKTGHLYCVAETDVKTLDLPLAEFRATLLGSDHGAARWIAALARESPRRVP